MESNLSLAGHYVEGTFANELTEEDPNYSIFIPPCQFMSQLLDGMDPSWHGLGPRTFVCAAPFMDEEDYRSRQPEAKKPAHDTTVKKPSTVKAKLEAKNPIVEKNSKSIEQARQVTG
jgi:hypothetical protein